MTVRTLLPLLALILIGSIRAQETDTAPDPDAPSGWLWIELAVLVDDRAETLHSEFWPPFPETRYPETHRWLLDPERLDTINAIYPVAEASQNETGRITVKIPDPQVILAEAQQALMSGEEDTPDPDPAEEIEPESAPEPIPLEMIDAEPEDTRASVDWLSDFDLGELTQSPDAETTELSAPTGADEPMIELEPEQPPPSLPTPFLRRQVTMLAPGLTALDKDTDDRLQLKVAWVQPARENRLPILLDDSGDSEYWPPLQGFIQVQNRDQLRLGVNFWWNTNAPYYPPEFSMPAPPRAPAQVELIDPITGRGLSQLEAVTRQQGLQELEAQKQRGEFPVTFVDPDTGLLVVEPIKSDYSNVLENSFVWPWRHFIHIADTRTVPAGSVRYFDHPVLKVIATYRELTWAETHALGDDDRKRREFDAALKAAADSDAGVEGSAGPPASTVPPERQLRQ